MNDLMELLGNLQDCPWSNWRPATLQFCEAHRCEWIVAPAETWSNLAYLAVAFVLLFLGWKDRARTKTLFRSVRFRLGVYAFLVGICSGLYHASHTFFYESLDLISMFLLGIEMLLQALRRLNWLKGGSPTVFAVFLFAGSSMAVIGLEGTDRLWIFTAMVVVTLWLESLVWTREKRLGVPSDFRGLWQSLGIFAVAYVFWILDYTRLVCAPDQHFWSGHSIWHVLNAVCFLTLSRFYMARSKLAPLASSL